MSRWRKEGLRLFRACGSQGSSDSIAGAKDHNACPGCLSGLPPSENAQDVLSAYIAETRAAFR